MKNNITPKTSIIISIVVLLIGEYIFAKDAMVTIAWIIGSLGISDLFREKYPNLNKIIMAVFSLLISMFYLGIISNIISTIN